MGLNERALRGAEGELDGEKKKKKGEEWQEEHCCGILIDGRDSAWTWEEGGEEGGLVVWEAQYIKGRCNREFLLGWGVNAWAECWMWLELG